MVASPRLQRLRQKGSGDRSFSGEIPPPSLPPVLRPLRASPFLVARLSGDPTPWDFGLGGGLRRELEGHVGADDAGRLQAFRRVRLGSRINQRGTGAWRPGTGTSSAMREHPSSTSHSTAGGARVSISSSPTWCRLRPWLRLSATRQRLLSSLRLALLEAWKDWTAGPFDYQELKAPAAAELPPTLCLYSASLRGSGSPHGVLQAGPEEGAQRKSSGSFST